MVEAFRQSCKRMEARNTLRHRLVMWFYRSVEISVCTSSPVLLCQTCRPYPDLDVKPKLKDISSLLAKHRFSITVRQGVSINVASASSMKTGFRVCTPPGNVTHCPNVCKFLYLEKKVSMSFVSTCLQTYI